MKGVYVAVLFVAVSGCASQMKFTEEGRKVRVINSGVATARNCGHIGMVTGWGPALVGGMPYAQIQIRNKVAAAGGNALVVASQSVSAQGHGEIIGDAYKCEF